MGGMGRERIHNMKHDFKFISKHSPQVKSAYSDLMEILSLVHDDLRKQYTFQHKPVGSYSRNMITYDAKSNIGFDFDINIYPNDEENRFTAKQIKLLFKQSLDKFAHRYGYDFAEDSTRVLTIKVKDRKNSRILHSVDFAFVNDYEDDDGYDCQEYIHYNKKQNAYSWSEQSQGFYMLPERFQWIKDNGLKGALYTLYIRRKNNNDDPNKHGQEEYKIVKIKEFYPRHKANLDDDWQNFELMLKREKQMEKLEKWIKEKQADTYIHIDESFKDTKFRYDGWIK